MVKLSLHEESMLADFDKSGADEHLIMAAKVFVSHMLINYPASAHRTSAIRRVLNAVMECNLSNK